MKDEIKKFAHQFKLTPRETEIFFLLASRVTTFKEIAQSLGSSPSTVKNQFKSIFLKTKTNTKSELLGVFIGQIFLTRKQIDQHIKIYLPDQSV